MAYLVFLLLLSWPAIAAAAQPLQNLSPLTAEEQRGQQIFEKGTSARGSKIEASLPGGVRVPASAVPCAGCHGIDGLGRPEGGIVPANVTWDALTKPYGHVRPEGRTRLPYSERTVRRAVTMGFDASGNQLSSVMPRFQLTMRDAADLIAYLKKLGETVDPGLTASTVRLGVLLPREQTVKNKQLVRQAVLHYFASVNSAGGVFGRAIETSFTELPSDTDTAIGGDSRFFARPAGLRSVGRFHRRGAGNRGRHAKNGDSGNRGDRSVAANRFTAQPVRLLS